RRVIIGICALQSSCHPVPSAERCSRSGLLCAEAGQGLPLLSRAPFSASRIRPSLRFGQVFLDEANTSCTIEMPASLRSDGVRDHPGMPFGFLPEYAFSFVGIPSRGRMAAWIGIDLHVDACVLSKSSQFGSGYSLIEA